MSKIVRIDAGRVVELFAEMPVLHEDLMTQVRDDAPDDVGVNWLFDGGNYVMPPPPPPPSIEDYRVAIGGALDDKAKERDYDNIVSACSYANSTNAKFKAEANALSVWRDQVWEYAAQQLALVVSGQIEQPTIDDFIESLPAFAWPEVG